MLMLKKEDTDKMETFINEAMDNNDSHFPNMTYEQGMQAVLEVAIGSSTVEEITT